MQVEVIVKANIDEVWNYWTNPEHITKWCQASDDWHAPYADNDLQVGGRFKTTMSAKDGSFSFDFEGTYTLVDYLKSIEYTLDDDRKVSIVFNSLDGKTEIIENFELENQNSGELQKNGWQAILNSFKNYVEFK